MLAERLKILRKLAGGISNRELDMAAGITKGHSWALESGKRHNAELRTIEAIAAATGATVGWLGAGEGDPPTEEQARAALVAAKAVRDAEEKAGSGEHAAVTPPKASGGE